jgi:hypothetical protein
LGRQKIFIRKKVKKIPYVLFYIYLLIALLSIFTVASYTWFTLSTTPQVSNMNVYITSGAGLELAASPGAEVWSNQLDIYSAKELVKYQGKDKQKPSLYQATWSDRDQCFYGPMYGYDGRLMSFSHLDYDKLEVISWYRLEDKINANSLSQSNYYIKATVYARSGQPTDVSLAGPSWLDDQQTVKGAGTYVIGDPNTGRGPETAVRIGFRTTYVDSSGDVLSEPSPLYIYEPNADRHVDGSQDYIPTYSVDEMRPQNSAATPPVSAETAYKNNWHLVENERLITQTFSRSAEETGEFITNPTIFSVKPGEIVRIEIYIWMEGQDVDCSNAMSNGVSTTKIEANIQFTGTTETQSGMVTIE